MEAGFRFGFGGHNLCVLTATFFAFPFCLPFVFLRRLEFFYFGEFMRLDFARESGRSVRDLTVMYRQS